MTVLETERLLLRRMTPDDAPFILGLLNEPSFIRNVGDKGVRTLADARQYILDGPVASYQRFGFGLWLVELKPSVVPIGICGLLKRDFLDHADIGFAFLPQFWSKGYAYESASAVMAHATGALGLDRILAITDPDNDRSIGVLERIGLRYEGMFRLSDDAPEVRVYAFDAG